MTDRDNAPARRGRRSAAEVPRQIGELGERHRLPGGSAESLVALLALVANDPLAPTTVRDPRVAVDEHLADSLVALELPAVRGAREVADLGSGAGFPGLPLAIALPAASVCLVESNRRKCDFLNRAIATAGAHNATVVHARAEDWPDGLGRFDLVTARALAAPAIIAEYAAPLLSLGGSVVMWRGRRDPDAERDAEAAGTILGLELTGVLEVQPFASAEHRNLYVMSKVAQTPSRFPRRPGVARKRPLRAAET